MNGLNILRAALVAVGLLVNAHRAQGQSSTAAAVALFDEGRAALQRGELDIACAKFKESNRLGPAVGTAFNLANCEQQRGRLATAWVLFRQVVSQMKPDDPRLPVATERVTELEGRIPRMVLQADEHTPPDTHVKVDELEFAGASFGSAIPLDPGQHRAIIRSPGAPTRTLAFTVAAGKTTTLALTPPPPATPVRDAAPTPPTASATQPTDDRILGLTRPDALLVAGGVGVVGLLVGVTAGVVGLNAQATGTAGCSDATKTCSQEGYDANQQAKTLAVVSTAGFVFAVAGGGALTYLYVTAPPPGASQQATLLGLGGRW